MHASVWVRKTQARNESDLVGLTCFPREQAPPQPALWGPPPLSSKSMYVWTRKMVNYA